MLHSYRNISVLRNWIQPNHTLKSFQSLRIELENSVYWRWNGRMSHPMHWDACVFLTMNAKSQLACGVPFSYAESLCLPWILSRDNSTHWGILRVTFFSYFPLLSYPAMTPSFVSPLPPLRRRWHNENRCGQLSSSICLSVCLAETYFLLCGADKCGVSALLFRGGRNEGSQPDEHFGQHVFNLYHKSQHLSNSAYFLIKIKTFERIDLD